MRILLFLLLPVTLLAQYPPDAKVLLTRADAPIFAAKTVRLAATQASGFAGFAPLPANPFKIEFVRGGRGRAEFLAGTTTITLMVFDGTNLWEYHDLGKQYTRKATTGWIFQGEIATLDYGRNPANIAAASYENEETINLGGRQVLCYVVRAEYRGAPKNRIGKDVVRRVWVSKDAELILRDYWEGPLIPGMTARQTETTNYTTIETDVLMPDDLFVFQPPPDSKLGEPIMVGGILGGALTAQEGGSLGPPPPPPPPRPAPPAGQSVQLGGTAAQANLIRKVNPVYPPEARQSGISGDVVLKATISKEGTVKDLIVLSGPALLRPAAIDAAKQWRYKPMVINENPVEVLTTITISFRLPAVNPERR